MLFSFCSRALPESECTQNLLIIIRKGLGFCSQHFFFLMDVHSLFGQAIIDKHLFLIFANANNSPMSNFAHYVACMQFNLQKEKTSEVELLQEYMHLVIFIAIAKVLCHFTFPVTVPVSPIVLSIECVSNFNAF